MIYYIADTHLRDQRIFDKCARPFNSLEEMEETLVQNWNKKVKDDDTVYVLGDIGKDDDKDVVNIFKLLKGEKHLIIGNHDHEVLDDIKSSNVFRTVSFIEVIMDKDRKVCICHYPIMDWMEFNRQGMFVFGHVHNKTQKNGDAYREIKEYYMNKPAYNCGVDITGFQPMTLDELKELKEANKNEPYIY